MVITVIQFSRAGVGVRENVVRDVDAGVVWEVPPRIEVVLVRPHRLHRWRHANHKYGKKQHQTEKR